MTTYSTRQASCAVCGHTSHTSCLDSTNSIGSPDLDLRPPEMRRSTIDSWIQRCPHCDYCAPNIERDEFQSAARISDPLYVETLEDLALPAKAREFLCWSLIAASAHKFDAAAWARINAAWICDDAGDPTAATKCRSLAIDSIEIGEVFGQALATQTGADVAIVVDLLRRCGRFDEARSRVRHALESVKDQTVRDVLHFQMHLCDSGDRNCHTIAQAVQPPPLNTLAGASRATPADQRRQAEVQERAAKAAGQSPRRFLQELASKTVVGEPGHVFPTISELPGLPLLKDFMAAEFKAHGWPEPVATLSFALALARVLPNNGEIARDIVESWVTACAGHEPIADFLHQCLRGSQPLHWYYSALTASGRLPPKFGGQTP
jgi:hypothetical protein